MYPADLKYAETHEWARVEGNVFTVGISAYAVEELTDLTYLELPRVGDSFRAGEPFGVIESVKATSDLYAPVSGEVVEVNAGLPDNLDAFKGDPYGSAWMVKIRAANPQEDAARLLSAGDYEKHVSKD
jgi:glycine cleavage system H protein